MPDNNVRKRKIRPWTGTRASERPQRSLRGSPEIHPDSTTRGERKKASLNETHTPIEQGGDSD